MESTSPELSWAQQLGYGSEETSVRYERAIEAETPEQTKVTEQLGTVAGYGYTAGLVPYTAAAGVDLNPFGMLSTLLSLAGNFTMSSKFGQTNAGAQTAQTFYAGSALSLRLAGTIDGKGLAYSLAGSASSLGLGMVEKHRIKSGTAGNGGLMDKIIKHKAVAPAALGLASRATMIEQTHEKCMEHPSATNYCLFAAACIWALSDTLYMLSTTKPEKGGAQVAAGR